MSGEYLRLDPQGPLAAQAREMAEKIKRAVGRRRNRRSAQFKSKKIDKNPGL
jgi:hypothetical protein